jgi:hypothetical protein
MSSCSQSKTRWPISSLTHPLAVLDGPPPHLYGIYSPCGVSTRHSLQLLPLVPCRSCRLAGNKHPISPSSTSPIPDKEGKVALWSKWQLYGPWGRKWKLGCTQNHLFSFQAGYEKQDIRTLILSVCSLGGGGCASTIYVKSCGTNVKQTTQLVVAKQASQGQANPVLRCH